ncbi:MAG: hypothetical protein ACYTDY_19700, partial [Planctomycetota bacterium]
RWNRGDRSWELEVGWFPFKLRRRWAADEIRGLALLPRRGRFVIALDRRVGRHATLMHVTADGSETRLQASRLARATGTRLRDHLGYLIDLPV